MLCSATRAATLLSTTPSSLPWATSRTQTQPRPPGAVFARSSTSSLLKVNTLCLGCSSNLTISTGPATDGESTAAGKRKKSGDQDESASPKKKRGKKVTKDEQAVKSEPELDNAATEEDHAEAEQVAKQENEW